MDVLVEFEPGRRVGYLKMVALERELSALLYWQDGGLWIGYLEEFPDYMTQAESFEELQENLRDCFVT